MTGNSKTLWVISLSAVLAMALLPVSSGFAAGAHCNLGTLKGQYLVSASGWVFPPAFGVTAPAISAAAAYSFYNGDGTGEDHVTFTVDGVVVVPATMHPEIRLAVPDAVIDRTPIPIAVVKDRTIEDRVVPEIVRAAPTVAITAHGVNECASSTDETFETFTYSIAGSAWVASRSSNHSG